MKIVNPVRDYIKSTIGIGLYNYLFEGDTTHLKPQEIFLTSQLFNRCFVLLDREDFTPKVIAEGIAKSKSDNLRDLLHLIDEEGLPVASIELMNVFTKKDNIVMLDYLFTNYHDEAMNNLDMEYFTIDEDYSTNEGYFTIGSIRCITYLRCKYKDFIREHIDFIRNEGIISFGRYISNLSNLSIDILIELVEDSFLEWIKGRRDDYILALLNRFSIHLCLRYQPLNDVQGERYKRIYSHTLKGNREDIYICDTEVLPLEFRKADNGEKTLYFGIYNNRILLKIRLCSTSDYVGILLKNSFKIKTTDHDNNDPRFIPRGTHCSSWKKNGLVVILGSNLYYTPEVQGIIIRNGVNIDNALTELFKNEYQVESYTEEQKECMYRWSISGEKGACPQLGHMCKALKRAMWENGHLVTEGTISTDNNLLTQEIRM
jgi:hypothetical protein